MIAERPGAGLALLGAVASLTRGRQTRPRRIGNIDRRVCPLLDGRMLPPRHGQPITVAVHSRIQVSRLAVIVSAEAV